MLLKRNSCRLLTIVLLAVWPLVVHMDMVRTRLSDQPWFPDIEIQADFFMHIRSVFFLVLAGIMLLFLIVDISLAAWRKKVHVHTAKADGKMWIKKVDSGHRRVFILPLLTAVIAWCMIASSLFSSWREIAFKGSFEQYETCPVLLGCLVVFWFFRRFKELIGPGFFVRSFLAGGFLQGLIGLSQIAGKDFWGQAIGRKLIEAGTEAGQALDLRFTAMPGGKIYLSFYHPNYAAVYLVMLLPAAMLACFYVRITWKRIICCCIFLLLAVCLFCTGSKSAVVVLPFICCLGILLLVPISQKGKLMTWVLLIVGGLCLSGAALAIFTGMGAEPKQYALKDVIPGKDSVRLVYGQSTYEIGMEEDNGEYWFSVRNEQGDTIPLEYDSELQLFCLTVADDSGTETGALYFDAYRKNNASCIVMYDGTIPWYFIRKDDERDGVGGNRDVEKDGNANQREGYTYYTEYGKPDQIKTADYWGVPGYEALLSERVYLWSRSLPLLKKNLMTGSGPCSFPLLFPQNDYVMRANLVKDALSVSLAQTGKKGSSFLSETIARPHSWYIQTALHTGLLSMILQLLIVAVVIGNWLFGSRNETFSGRMAGTALVLSVIAFMMMSLASDGTVLTLPFFWACLGMCKSKAVS